MTDLFICQIIITIINYYKLLHVHGESKNKSHYHKLVHGPCTKEFNTALLQHLIDIILEQICAIYHMVSTKYVLKLQDQTTMVGVCANKAIESFLDFDDHFFGDFKLGKPVQLNWLQTVNRTNNMFMIPIYFCVI